MDQPVEKRDKEKWMAQVIRLGDCIVRDWMPWDTIHLYALFDEEWQWICWESGIFYIL